MNTIFGVYLTHKIRWLNKWAKARWANLKQYKNWTHTCRKFINESLKMIENHIYPNHFGSLKVFRVACSDILRLGVFNKLKWVHFTTMKIAFQLFRFVLRKNMINGCYSQSFKYMHSNSTYFQPKRIKEYALNPLYSTLKWYCKIFCGETFIEIQIWWKLFVLIEYWCRMAMWHTHTLS